MVPVVVIANPAIAITPPTERRALLFNFFRIEGEGATAIELTVLETFVLGAENINTGRRCLFPYLSIQPRAMVSIRFECLPGENKQGIFE